MSETLLAIAAWVFTHPAANTIYAETPQDNPASQRVLEKNGFRKVKTLEKTILWEAQRDKVPLHDDTRKQTL